MVARIVSGKSIRGMLSYNETKVDQGEAKLILASGFATDIDRLNFHQKLYRFEQLTRLNSRVKTNALHISLNFHVNDKLDPATLQQISAEYMDKIGLGDQPFIVYQHLDASHPHLHIATTLIQKDGKRIITNGIGKTLSEPARKQLEEKYNLIKAQGRQLKTEPYLKPAEYGAKSTKQQLNNITKAVMRDYAYTSFTEYKAVLAQFNVQVDRGAEDSTMFEKKGLVYSIQDQNGNAIGVPFKASAFFQGATMERVEKHFENNQTKRLAKKQELIDRIDGVFQRYESISRQTLVKELGLEQIALVFRQNEKGLVYGMTYIDHRQRTVFNGSDLGKGYSARAVMERVGSKDVPRKYLMQGVKGYLGKGERGEFSRKENGVGDKEEKDLGLGKDGGGASLLDGLLAKADYDGPTVVGKRKKKRKSKDQSQNFNI
jgi:hypothetical protein